MAFPDMTPLRRSTRRRKIPVSYAVFEEDQMEDIMPTLLSDQYHQEQQLEETLVSHSSTVKVEGLAKHESLPTIVNVAGGAHFASLGGPQPCWKLQEDELSDESDGEYGVRSKRKKSKVTHLYETIVVGNTGNKEVQVLRKICDSLGIDLASFDGWADDPRLKDLSKMNIPFMPNEIIIEIFRHCRSEVLIQCERSCQRFRDILKDTRIWRQARSVHYPGLDSELPYNLDELSLFELATEKKCDYCKSEKARPYYAWSIRSCQECIKSLTMSISEFKKMFKKKCGEEEDWTPYRREQVCNAIHWHKNPNYSKICWKEYAYNLIEDAEVEMLAGTFDDWIKIKQISRLREKTDSLEAWGSIIPKKIDADRRRDEEKVRALRKACFHDWCMRLPRPIPVETLVHTKAYGAFCRLSNYPTTSEFIRQLPKLIAERDCYEKKERERKRHLMTLYRIQQDSALDRACSYIIQKVIEEGPLSALSWCNILQTALQQVVKTPIKIKVPGDWENDWNDIHLMKLMDMLDEKLCSKLDTTINGDSLHPSTYEFFCNGEDRVFGCPAALESCPTSCKCKDVMNFQELVSHTLLHKNDLKYRRNIWTDSHNAITIHPTIKQSRPITIICGKQYWQKELQLWFKPSPQMTEPDRPTSWINPRYSGVFKAIMKQRLKSEDQNMTNSGDEIPVAGASNSFGWVIEGNGLRGGNKNFNHKSIMAYFHIQKRPVLKTQVLKTKCLFRH